LLIKQVEKLEVVQDDKNYSTTRVDHKNHTIALFGNWQSFRTTCCSNFAHMDVTHIFQTDLPSCDSFLLTDIPFSQCFGQMASLHTLTVCNVPIMRKLPANFGSLTSLQELTLSNVGLEELPASFGQLEMLCKLHFSVYPMEELPLTFKDLTSLTDLSFWQGGLKTLPSNFGDLPSLTVLRFQYIRELEGLPSDF